MQTTVLCIISEAEPSKTYPDTIYISLYDMDKGTAFQLSTREVGAAYFGGIFKIPVVLTCDLQVRNRVGGQGYSLIASNIHIRKAGDDAVLPDVNKVKT